jgi:basic membrane lipoprotein Med (substrate-binding protein (PBP1-ABC) superfamily)
MRPIPTLSTLALFLVLAACTGGESSAAENPQSPSFTQKAKDAALKARDEAGAKLAEWKESAERSLASHEASLEQLRKKASTLAGKEKERLDAAIAELEPKRKELAAKLADLGQQGEEAWTKAKPELDRLAAELKRIVDEHRE